MSRNVKLETTLLKGLGTLSQWLAYCSGAALLLMMILVNANVLLRPMGRPIWGSYELVGFLGSVTLSLALLRITMNRGHMVVEILTDHLPDGVNRFLDRFNRVLGTAIMALVSWRSFCYARQLWQDGEVSPTLTMSYYPFVLGVAVAFGLSALAMLLAPGEQPQGEEE